ncbi:VOC family protein [Salinilacihabitans rarus]|uniref:VOC family protein n=1 Tax=Salinilacihabitans rarus TaxID=2961596 RepID=UPI0020C887F8|nr:VOC family protein [Salinilacihabitans rarus]
MSGIAFFATESLERVVDFYVEEVGASVWLEQPDCTILQYDNLLFGFCEREAADTDGVLTFVFETREAVDAAHERLRERATDEPHENERYRIYQFFAEDPEGRTIEFQTFLHETEPV